MKKLFICALALASVVACSKDDATQSLESGSKSVTISIANAVDATRADFVGGDTTPGTQGQSAVAEATDLKILFANNDGTVLKELSLVGGNAWDDTHTGGTTTETEYIPAKDNASGAGKYTWHNVPWDVTRIAVVRYEANEFAQGVEGKDLETDLEAAALSETLNVARELDDIILYGTAPLENTGRTHQVGDIIYHVWDATIEVAPLLARVEISSISCTDLGDDNKDKNEDGTPNNATMGFDEIDILSMVWNAAEGDNTYSTVMPTDATDDVKILGTLYGSYVPNTVTNRPEGADNTLEPNKAWSWNVNPSTTQFGSMKVDMNVRAYDYAVVKTNQPLNITGLSTKAPDAEGGQTEDVTFSAKNIYRFSIPFTEDDIKTTEDGLCVEVNVTVATWKVNTVYPIFGN